MQPVMQQTNYIHVAKGGTVILPGGANQQNQVTHQHENQPLSSHQSNSPRVGAPQNGTPAPPGYYQVKNTLKNHRRNREDYSFIFVSGRQCSGRSNWTEADDAEQPRATAASSTRSASPVASATRSSDRESLSDLLNARELARSTDESSASCRATSTDEIRNTSRISSSSNANSPVDSDAV